MLMKSASWLLVSALLPMALLSGCAGTYQLENDVQAFSTLTALPAPATYRFDTLPLQAGPPQTQLELWAVPALEKIGMRRDDATPRFSVQVGARINAELSPWASPWDASWGFGGRWGGFHHGFRGGLMYHYEPPWYHREVSLIVRELPSNRVIFESHAQSDEPRGDNVIVFPAMFDAALAGFPNPPPGLRRVNVLLGH
jgi:hypothetical protein